VIHALAAPEHIEKPIRASARPADHEEFHQYHRPTHDGKKDEDGENQRYREASIRHALENSRGGASDSFLHRGGERFVREDLRPRVTSKT